MPVSTAGTQIGYLLERTWSIGQRRRCVALDGRLLIDQGGVKFWSIGNSICGKIADWLWEMITDTRLLTSFRGWTTRRRTLTGYVRTGCFPALGAPTCIGCPPAPNLSSTLCIPNIKVNIYVRYAIEFIELLENCLGNPLAVGSYLLHCVNYVSWS